MEEAGPRLREMLPIVRRYPEEFSRREVIDILRAHYDSLG